MPEGFSTLHGINLIGHPITGVIHIGAHHAEERGDYDALGLPVIWVEAHPEYAKVMYENLSSAPGQIGYELCLSDVEGEEVEFYTTADEYASSMLKPAIHQEWHPHAQVNGIIKLTTRRFDNAFSELDPKYNLLVLDVQGAEKKVWDGMGKYQDNFDGIISEYSTIEFYEGVPRLEDLDRAYVGFERVYPGEVALDHADAVYRRTK